MVNDGMNEKLSTEDHILEVAREVFTKNGYDGTSMQMIADAAGINKSLLHYYYRSKEKLFKRIKSFQPVYSPPGCDIHVEYVFGRENTGVCRPLH